MVSVSIPSSVTSIGKYAFDGCSSLASVSIPSSVTSIGNNAFYGCTGKLVVNCKIPDYSNGGSAFNGSQFESVEFGNTVTSIGNDAFRGCSSLVSVSIPSSVTSIGNYAFGSCSSLTSVSAPNVTHIGYRAFEYCHGLTSVSAPNLTSIGEMAFNGCSLNSFEIANNASIGNQAFYNCPIKDVYLNMVDWSANNALASALNSPGSINWRYYANGNRDSLLTDDVVIPDSVTKIGNNVLRWCSTITSLTIPNSVSSIGSQAFASCTNLKSITSLAVVPPTLASDVFKQLNVHVPLEGLADYTLANNWKNNELTSDFENVAPLEINNKNAGQLASRINQKGKQQNDVYALKVTGSLDETDWTTLSSANMQRLVYLDLSELDLTEIPNNEFKNGVLYRILMPETVTSIGNSAFRGTRVFDFDLPAGVTSIGEYAYAGSYISEAVIPAQVKDLKANTFDGCAHLQSLKLPYGLQTIGANAFNGCKLLTELDIPETVTSWQKYPFANCGNALKLLSVHWQSPVSAASDFFKGVDCNTCELHIPYFTASAYLQAPGWNSFKNTMREAFGIIAVTCNEGGYVMVDDVKVCNETRNVQLYGGRDIKISVVPDEEAEIVSVILDDKDITSQLIDGTYTLPELDDNYTFEVVFKSPNQEGIEVITADAASANVYDLMGRKTDVLSKNKLYIDNRKKFVVK